MASEEWKSDAALIDELAENPARFSFFRAVQILQRANPHAARIGELGPARREAIRFVQDPNLIFHAADITAFNPRVIRDGVPFAEITSSFLGLYGTVSPLATFLSEEVIRAEREDEPSLKAFYDVFQHRILSLLFRAWKKYRFAEGFRVDGGDIFTRRALATVGVDATAMPREGLSPLRMLAMAPLLAIRTRPARSLQIVLERLFPGTGITLESFIARRVILKDDQLAKLGTQNSMLGSDMTIGRSVIDRSGRFRVGIGPVDYETFEGLLPGGRLHPMLRKVIDQFSRGVLEVECEVTVADRDAPRFELGVEKGAKLGVTTTLRPKRGKAMTARFVLSDDVANARPMIMDETVPMSIKP